MNLSRQSVAIIIALMVISLAGLVGLQVYLLQLALDQKEQAFRRNVFMALNAVAQKLENRETYTIAMKPGILTQTHMSWEMDVSAGNVKKGDSIRIQGMFISDESERPRTIDECPVSFENGVLRYELRSPQRVMIKAFDQSRGTDTMVVDTFNPAGIYEINLASESIAGQRMMYLFHTDSNSAFFQLHEGAQVTPVSPLLDRTRKGDYVERILSNMVVAEMESIEERIDEAEMDSLIHTSLLESGIDLDFEYAVYSGLNDSLRIPKAVKASSELRRSDFRTRLFPSDFLAAKNELSIHFPSRTAYLWKQMSFLVLTNLLFITIIIAVFVYTIRVMLAQKRFSGRIVDFINNMTHEFKTPISTVALACEAILRPEVMQEPGRVGKYGRMILDENRRMRHQVDKILQMAVIEEGDYELQLDSIDIHQIIRQTVEGISLQVESRGGRIIPSLGAENPVILGDSLHMTNIVTNLLDNANKYSQDAPLIEIATRNELEELVIAISDHGIGISDEDQRAVFDKYFRVPSGNVHNVKGFGLGLSYVRKMVEAMKGKISLRSKLGEGTIVELRFPISNKAE